MLDKLYLFQNSTYVLQWALLVLGPVRLSSVADSDTEFRDARQIIGGGHCGLNEREEDKELGDQTTNPNSATLSFR